MNKRALDIADYRAGFNAPDYRAAKASAAPYDFTACRTSAIDLILLLCYHVRTCSYIRNEQVGTNGLNKRFMLTNGLYKRVLNILKIFLPRKRHK